MPSFLGDARTSEVDPDALDPALADAWSRLQTVWADAPASEAVPTLADEILAQDPPLALALEAMHAKAGHAYLVGQDPRAAQVAVDALGQLVPAEEPTSMEQSLRMLRLRALARGGDPQVALSELDDASTLWRSGLPLPEVAGLRAVAYERDAQFARAVAAFAQWRESLADDSAAAAYIDTRIAALGGSMPAQAMAEEAATLEPGPARRCLEALGRVAEPDEEDLAWVRACAGPPVRVGVLLPRTGRLSALADVQLAAASISAATLAGQSAPVLWRDAGSSPKMAVAGAQALLEDGATVLIGPVGSANVRAVQDAVGARARVIVPGESVAGAQGVAPSLEARAAGLVRLARERGATQLMILAPQNGYGKRALAAIKTEVGPKAVDDLVIQTYPPETTSFSPLITPLFGGLRPGGAVIVPDHVSRLEAVVRQLIRLDRAPSESAKAGVMVLSTAEGASAEAMVDARKVFANVWMAPAAWRSDASRTFEQAFFDAEGRPAADQELLVFRAFRHALSPADAAPPAVVFAHVGADGVVRTAR